MEGEMQEVTTSQLGKYRQEVSSAFCVELLVACCRKCNTYSTGVSQHILTTLKGNCKYSL